MAAKRCDALLELGSYSYRFFKAWSQNLGHDGVLTTFSSYGEVPLFCQAELIRRSKSTCDFKSRVKIARVFTMSDVDAHHRRPSRYNAIAFRRKKPPRSSGDP